MGKKFFLLLFFLSGVAAWCGGAVNESEMNSVLASVNGEAISLKDVLTLTRQQEYLAYAAFSGDKLTAEIKRIRKKAVDELIDRKLLVAEYHKQSFRISSRDIENEIDRTAQRMGCRSRDEFRSKMLAEQVDFESFRKELVERMIHVCMIQRLAMIEGAPTPKEVYEYFQKHRKSLAVSESYELAMLKLDSQIFRRNMPANLRNGLCLVLTGEAVSPLGFRYREFHFRLFGRDEAPAILRQRFSAIRTGLPLEMFVQVRSVRLPEPVSFVNWKILKLTFDESSCNGAAVMTGSMELAVQVCFAP